MKNFFICDFFDFSRKFFKAFFAFFVLFFLNFSAFAENVYYRWTPYPDSAGTWDGDWSVTYKDGVISKAKFWSYWKESESKWEKTFNNTGGTADYPGYYPDPNQKKLAYTYFTGEHAVTATLDSSPANELAELHIGDCYNSQAAGSEKITIELAGFDLKAETLVLGSLNASVTPVNFALTEKGTLVSKKMYFEVFSGDSGASDTYEYNIEVASGTVLDVSSIELNDSRAIVNFSGDGTLKVGKAIFSAGKININVKNLEISGKAEFSGGSKISFGGAVTNSGSAEFKDSAEGIFNGTVKNSGRLGFSGTAKGTFNGAVTNATRGIFGFSGTASGTFAQDFTNNAGGNVSFSGTAKGTFNGAVTNATRGIFGFSGSAEGTFSRTVRNSGIFGFLGTASGTFAQDFINNAGGAVSFSGTAKGTFNGAVTNATSEIFGFSDSAEGTFNGTVKNSGTLGFSDKAKGTFSGAVTNVVGGTFDFSGSAIGTFDGTVENSGTLGFSATSTGTFAQDFTNNTGGTVSFAGTAKGTFSSAFLNSGVVDLKNASSHIKFDGNFTNNKDGTVTLPDAAGASVTFGTVTGTGTDSFSNSGTVNSSGLCSVAFANSPVADGGTWIYTGGAKTGQVILSDISYNILILKGNLKVAGNLTAKDIIIVETDSLKIEGEISSGSIEVKTEKPIELTGNLTVDSLEFTLSENTDFQINNHELVFGTNGRECKITSGSVPAKNLSFFGTAGSKINFHSASFGQGTDIIGDFYSEPDVLFNCDVHAKSLTAKNAEIHAAEINTSGKQEYSGAVTVAAASPLVVSALEVTFSGAVTTFAKTGITASAGAVKFEKPIEAGDEFSVNADLTSGSAEFKEAVNSTSKIEVSAKTARFNSSVSAGSASILADTVFFSDCNISVAPGQFSIGDSTSPKNTVVETSKNVKFKDISDGDFYGKFNNRGNVSFENCGNIKILGDSLNSGGFLCSGISDFEISGTFENAGTAEFSGGSKSSFVGAVTNSGLAKFKDSAEGTFSSEFSNSGTVDLKNASSQIKFDRKFTNNQDGTVTLPDAAGAGVIFGTGTALFSNFGTVNSSGLCAVTFANRPVTDGGEWVYTGGATSGKVILASDISYNSLILKGKLVVPGDLKAKDITVETESLKIQGIISSDSIDVKTANPIELTGNLTVDSLAFSLSENTNFKINNYELVFGTDAKKCAITSGAAKNLSFFGTAGSKINFYSASIGQKTGSIGDFYSEPDVLFNCDVHAKSLTAKKTAEIHAAEINTTGKQEYYGAVTVSANSPLAVSASEASFSGAVTTFAKTGITARSGAVKFEKPVEAGDEFSVNADSTGGSVTFASTVNSTSKIEVSAKTARFNSTVSAGALSVIAEKSFFRSDVNVSGKVDISGKAASVQFDSDFISSGISVFDADVYFSAKRKNDVEIRTEKISVGSENSEKNLYISAVDDAASAKNINWKTPADVSGNFVLLNGNITLSNNHLGKTPEISAGKDIVLLNGDSSSMYNDSVSAKFNWRSDAEGIFKYSGRENSNAVFPVAFPDGTQISSEKFISSLSGLENGVKLSAGKNFYCNGVNLEGDSAWNLKAGNNENSENFAEAYASSIKNCNFSSSGNGISFLSAAESFDKTGKNKNVCFGHPEIALARTVYDDVIEVSFKDSVSGEPVKIENSNNEIWKNIAENPTFLTYENNGSKISFTGTFVDAECTESTDGKGDLEKFFIKAPEPWNTDATGKSPGEAQSTDMNGIHRSAVPYLNIVRAVSGNLQGLRDEHKNRIASYDGAAKRFEGVTDSCPPVLLAVRTGQELHEKLPEKQKTHDSHNFLEFQYSEEIFVNGGDSSVVNVQSSAELAGISNSSENGILVSGLAQFERGKVSLGSESGIAPEKLNSIYRNFAVSLSKGESPQTHRFRISLAGYQSQSAAENPSGFPYWPGYIDSENTEIPSGKIVQLPFDDANSENSTDSDFNDFIKDAKDNSLLVKSRKNHELQTLSVISDSTKDSFETDWNNSVYGLWDLSAPVFAFYHSLRSNARRIYETCEILGACEASDTVLNRIEFHVFDNSEEFFNDLGAEWYSHFGWGKDKKTLFAEDSYASDIFGGSRPFGNSSGASAKTSGGIRYSTLYNKSSYFKYGIDSDSPAEEFKDSAIKSGASSSLFLSQIRKPREISSNDSLYFSIFLKDGTNLPLKTNFSIKFDEKACVTDLAGNLMKSAVVKSVDLVPPRFNMTSAKISGNKLYIVFNKKISLVPVELENSDGTTESFGIADSLRFIKIPENPHKFDEDEDVVSDLYIEKGIPPQETYSSDTFTGLIFTLNRNVTLEDVKNYYIQCFSPGSGKFVDPFTGISDVKVTSVTDINGIYMANGEAHALSDFAVNAVNPVYAYDDRFLDENFGFSASDAKQSNLSVHDWNKEQQNDGTLLTEHDIFVVTSQDSGISGSAEKLPEKIIMYYDNAPDSDSVSSEYNKNLEENLRVWIPSFVPYGEYSNSSVEKVSPILALSSSTNSRNFFVSGEIDKNIAKFSVDWETLSKNGYSSGNQISFLFGLAESDGSATKICHAPAYDEISGVYKLEKQPLFALRLKNSNDPVSLDLWSFRLKSAVLQRGNVTIFNNVIDVNKGEMSVVRVNMPSEGKLDVIVMTLDGNIIRYLQHGTASAGEHNYSWNGTSKSGKKVARGLYFVRVFGNGIDETRKIMVVKN